MPGAVTEPAGWACVCRFPGGRVERTLWITQDGADQMAAETEAEGRRKRRRVACEVMPAGDGEAG